MERNLNILLVEDSESDADLLVRFLNKEQIKFNHTRNVQDYEKLWLSEKRLFDSGESSLFMINNREISYINAKIKLNEMINKKQKSGLEAEYAFGELNTNY